MTEENKTVNNEADETLNETVKSADEIKDAATGTETADEKPSDEKSSDEKSSDEKSSGDEKASADEKTSGDEKLSRKDKKAEKSELKQVRAELESAKKIAADALKSAQEVNEKYLRIVAEYDNFRRRSAKEREGVYTDAYADAVSQLLPVIDNLDRAAAYTEPEKLAEGVALILKTLPEVLAKMGVEEIPTEKFDPNVHNAVMHDDDPDKEEGVIADVFQKGYRRGDKIIRHAMVKVIN